VITATTPFTGVVKIVLANPDHRWPRPEVFSINYDKLARLLETYKALTADQIAYLGLKPKRLGKLAKYGFVYCYYIRTEDGTLPSAFSLGPVARKYTGIRYTRFDNATALKSLIAVNQILLFLRRFEGTASVEPNYPRGVYTLTRPSLVLALRLGFYPEQVEDYPQAMVMLPDPDYAIPGIPVRYCFDTEAADPSFIPFYKFNGNALERTDLV